MNSISHQRLRRVSSIVITSLSLLLLLTSISLSQGTITGKIIDEQSGESLIGANILILTTATGGATDLDGNYTVKNIPVGTYNIRFSMVGYANKLVEGVKIEEGKKLTINIALESEAIQTNEVVIKADAVYNTESAILMKRKESVAISDGMSSEQIKRSPDATSGDALKRMTGVSIVDNKFVFIRGITDRYNLTTLDGASVTSTESGKRGFSFDLLPAGLLENTSVVKSASPELPGDFTGGLVQLNTLDFPTHRALKFGLSTGINSVTTSKEFLRSQGGGSDMWGFDDGSRAFPGDRTDPNQIGREAKNNWAPRGGKAPYNGSYSFAFGDRFVFNEDEPTQNQLGFITALTYRSTFQRNEKRINDLDMSRHSVGAKDESGVLWGAIANVNYQIDGIHKFSFRNNFNQSASDDITSYLTSDTQLVSLNRYTIVNWTQRSSYTGQLGGEHNVPLFNGLNIQWKASLSSSRREDPDRKEVYYYSPMDDPSVPYYAAVNKRSWAYLNERGYTFSNDYMLPVLTSKIKFGALYEKKTTNYNIRYFDLTPDYTASGSKADSLAQLPLETIYSPENIGPKKIKFTEASRATDSYNGNQNLIAAYVMTDMPFTLFGNNFRFTGGARLENSEQRVNIPRTLQPDGPMDNILLKNIDILPSLNLTHYLSKETNVRFAYSHTLNRPEFRELSTTQFFEPVKKVMYIGNPNLQRSFVHNYDLRVEWFPEVGELFAVSYFHKTISNAIEERVEQASTKQQTWFNSDHATNHGWEVEARKSFGFLGGYLQNFSLSANYTRIFSNVLYSRLMGNSSNSESVLKSRPMQGQSPYSINVSLLFIEPNLGTSVSVLYNRYGRRIDAVDHNEKDYYEEPRDLIDLAITQPFMNMLEVKAAIKNINGKEKVITRDGLMYELTGTGATYSLQLSLGL